MNKTPRVELSTFLFGLWKSDVSDQISIDCRVAQGNLLPLSARGAFARADVGASCLSAQNTRTRLSRVDVCVLDPLPSTSHSAQNSSQASQRNCNGSGSLNVGAAILSAGSLGWGANHQSWILSHESQPYSQRSMARNRSRLKSNHGHLGCKAVFPAAR
eukprot:62841-Amphidinium_carterae.2